MVTSTAPASDTASGSPSSTDSIIGSGPVTTSCPPRDPNAPEVTPFCVPYSDPDKNILNICMCDDGGYYSADSPCDMCPWTTTPPASLSVQTATTTAEGPAFTIPPNPNCGEGKAPNAECWESIGAVVAINDFWDSNKEECEADGFNGFASCWYSRKLGKDSNECGAISTDSGCSQPSWDQFSEDENPLVSYYVSFAIWNAHKFFIDLWEQIPDSASSAQAQVGQLVETLAPKDETNPWKYILFAMSFALSLYAEGSASTKAGLRVPGQTSTLLNNIFFPPSTQGIEDKIATWAESGSQLGFLADAWQVTVADTSSKIFSGGPGNFLTWCNNDFFCTAQPANLADLGPKMKLSLGTYVASQSIQSLDLVVSRAAGLDVADLQATEGDNLRWDTGCEGYDDYGACGSYVFDGTDTYSIVSKSDFAFESSDTIELLFGGTQPLTTAELLFTGGYQCSQECSSGGCEPSLGTDFTPVCLSSIPVCTWNWDNDVPWNETEDCPNDMFGWRWCQARCRGNAFNDKACTVPKLYLGGGIMSDTADGPWSDKAACNNWG